MQTIQPKDLLAASEEHLQQGNAATSNLYIRLFKLIVRVIFLMFFRVRVFGKENVPRTPVIVCANHMGWADVFLVLLFFPVEPRIYVLGEQQVKYMSKFRRWLVDSLQIMVMLDRNKPLQALHIMEDVLRRGGSILIFPEGHLGTREGELLELQNGAAHASIVTGVPLLPVGITGTSELWLRRSLVMRIGTAIAPTEFEGELRPRMNDMTARLAVEMLTLLPGDRQHTRVKLLRRWLTKLL